MSFYVISNKLFDDSKYAYGEAVQQETGDFEKCEACGLAISMRRWLPPLNAKLSKPSYGDFVFGTFTTFLVSERFKQEYLKSGLYGINKFEPVEITKVSRKKPASPAPPQYYNVLIGRSNAKIDEKKSRFIRDGQIECSVCRIGGVIKSFEGVFFEKDTWSGEDIFFPTGLPGTIVVTQRFHDFIKNNSFTNIKFVPAQEYKPPWGKYYNRKN